VGSIRTLRLDMQRACGTSLEAAIDIGNKIALGQIDAGLAGGTDSISDAPIVYPRAYQHCCSRATAGATRAAAVAWLVCGPALQAGAARGRRAAHRIVHGQSTEIMAKRWQITLPSRTAGPAEPHEGRGRMARRVLRRPGGGVLD